MFVTSTQRVTMSGQQQSPDVERQNLLDRLLDAVKQCQVRFGGKTELATDGDSRVTCLLTQFEAVLQHGFKRSRSRISAFRQVGQVAGIVKLDSDSVFWSFVKEHLGKLDVERFLSLEKATTDAGRGRAWLRSSLNEHSLERYFHYMIQNKALLSQFYEKEAFMMDEERTSMLPMMAAGLSPILFALTVDSEELNIVRQVPALTINKDVLSNILPSFPQKPVAEPPPVYSAALTTTEDSKLDKKKKKKKKKKRVHAAIVSIEEDDSGTRDLPLTDSSVQNNDHTSRTSTHGHARSSSYPGNKAVVPEGSTASVNGGEIVFTEISKSISLPDNSVTDSAVENNSTVIRSFDYEDFEGHLTGGKYVGEGEEETLSLDDRENFNFGSVDLFQRESKLERVVNISPQDIAEKEGNESNVAAMPVQTERKGNSSFDIQSITEIKRSNTNLSTTGKEKPDVTEKQSADIKSTKESCYFTPVASVEGFSDMRRTTPVRSNVDFGASSSNEQRLEALADVRSRTTNQQGVEEVENELEPDQDLDDCDEMTISEPQQVYTGDDEVEPVVVLDSGESLVPLMEGGHATKASAQSAFDNASEFTVDKDRDSASLSSTSWSYIEEGEEFTEAKDELNNGSGSMAAASDAAAALAACSDVQRGMAHMNRGFTTMERTVGDRTSYQENVNKHEGMSTGELKQAIVSMMLKKDEIEEQNRNLGNLLNEERQKSEQLNSEREELREEMKQQDIRQSRQIGSLSRENELLKHQLKKYVGAVQALKSDLHGKSSEAMEALQGIRQEEILPSLPPEQGTEEERLSEEAEEYKRKLIQVADLHGELMEFNERLQRQIGFYQSQIRRLREELINLRGPLPEDSEVPHDVTNLSDFDPAVMSVGTRPLVNVWIPSVFLRGRSSNVHHVYQVYVRIKDDEWNVYRRYSQFFEMHKNLRRRYPVVDSFKFPPKKALGNKDSRFVEDRRRLLQDYVRRVVNLYATCDQELISSTTKPTLILILPFFGDPFPPEKTKKESTSRRKRSAHYTGL